MFFENNLKKRILKFVAVSVIVTGLIVSPPHLGKDSLLPVQLSSQVSVQAQTPTTNENTKTNNSQPEKQQESSEEKLDPFKMTMGAIAGLVLFLYGVTRMAEGMEAIAGDRVKDILSKFTTNRFAGVATGAVATAILDSSSVTIIVVIAMVSAGLLTFVQSLGVVLGSNIGTTIGAQLVAFNIDDYAPIALFIGLLMTFLGRTNRQKSIGLIILGLGLLFFGLGQIEDAMEPFKGYQPFLQLMEHLGKNTLLGALIGALFTILIQSSSATVAIVVTLASQGLIALPAGIAIMLGAEVGTCADTLVATIGRERPAIRTGVFHLLFNLITAAVGILLAAQLASFAQGLSSLVGSGDNIARQIANAQLIFNLIGVVLVIGFLPLIARGLEKLIPNGQDETSASDSDRSDRERAELEPK